MKPLTTEMGVGDGEAAVGTGIACDRSALNRSTGSTTLERQ